MKVRLCATPGCTNHPETLHVLCISCELLGLPDPPKKPRGRPVGYAGKSSNAPHAKRAYHRLRAKGYSAQCASHKHPNCHRCSCDCHSRERTTAA